MSIISAMVSYWNTRGTRAVNSVSWSPDGTRLATASDDHTARVWDARSGAEVLALKGHTGAVNSVSWSPDGTRLATASIDHSMYDLGVTQVWDARSGVETLDLAAKNFAGFKSVSWSPDGTRLATASQDKSTRVWDARTGPELSAAGW